MSLSLHVHICKTAAWSFISVGCLYLAILIICIINFKGSIENCLQTSFSEAGCKILLATLITTALYVLDDACIICMHYVCLHTYCLVCTHRVSCMLRVSRACTRCVCMLHALHSTLYPLTFFSFMVSNANWTWFFFFFSLGRAQRWGWTWEAWEVNVIRVHYAKLPKKQ